MSGGSRDWDRVVDVVVVGSGGAALTAATLAHDGGAEVLVLEKAGMLGGTTAVSGGGVWLPGNHLMAEAGIDDSREDALAYIRRLAGGREPDPELLEVFVDTAPEVLRYLEDHTPLETHISPLPDYYWPWGIPGNRPMPARCVEADPYPVRKELPEWADRLVSPRDADVVGRGDDADRGLRAEDGRAARGARSPGAGGHPAQGRRAHRASLQGAARPRRRGDVGDAGVRDRHRRRRGGDRRRRGARREDAARRRAQGRRARVRRLRVEPGARARAHRLRREAAAVHRTTSATG